MANHEGSAISTARIQIQAIQTVVSMKQTEPPLTQRVVLNEAESVKGVAFQQCHRMLLYYKKANADDSAWVMIGRLKESLGRALLKYPMFTGRIKQSENADGKGKELLMVSNDCGLRLVEAKYPSSMDDFLGRASREEEAESELVYWEDLKELHLQFCPLSYIQVTDFECGGYSIGMSLSVLLGDSSTLSGFLKYLTSTHLDIFFKNKPPPQCYLPKHKAIKSFPVPSNKTRRTHRGQTLLYHVNAEYSDRQGDTIFRTLSSSCLKDVEQKLEGNLDFDFTVFSKNTKTGYVTVEKGGVQELTLPHPVNAHPKLNAVEWDDKIFKEATFWEGHTPILGTYWIGLHDKEGLVMVNMSPLDHDDKTINITISVP